MYQNPNRLVSIVMPSYNHAHFLPRAIGSIIAQTYTCWELIIIDNQSLDDTEAVISSFADTRIRILRIHNDGIVAKSRNLGIKEAKGEFIAFLDSDDWWCSNKLETSIKYIDKGADIVYHDLFFVQDENHIHKTKLKSRALKKPIFKSLITGGNAIINSSVVVRTKLLNKSGFIDEQKGIVASEDYDLWLRISILTDKFYMIKECLGYYWYVGGNLSKNKNFSEAGQIILNKYRERLNSAVLAKAEGYLKYLEAMYNLANGNKIKARCFFWESLKRGAPYIKIKSIYRVIRLII